MFVGSVLDVRVRLATGELVRSLVANDGAGGIPSEQGAPVRSPAARGGRILHDTPAGRTLPAWIHAAAPIALLALTLGVFLVTLNVTIVIVALPEIARDLDAGHDATAWIIDAYNLVGASLLLSAGFFADRFGRRRMLVTGYVLFAGGALLCAVAPNVGWLLAFRTLQALGGTALTPTSLAIVANLYPDARERARAIGIWGISSGIGLGLGPIIGGATVDALGWRAVFAVNAAIGLAALVAVLRFVPASRSEVPRRLDVWGQVLAIACWRPSRTR